MIAGALVVATLGLAPRASADEADISAAQRRANQAAAEYAQAQTELAQIEQGLTDLEHRTGEAEARMAALRASVQEVALRSYVRSDEAVAAWMVGGDLNQHVVADAMARFVTVGQEDVIDEYRRQRQDLDAAQAELTDRRADQQVAIGELEQRKAALEAELARLQEEERRRQEEEARRRAEEEQRRQAEAARQQQASAARAAAPQRAASSGGSGSGGSASSGSGSGGNVIAAPSGGEWVCPVQGPRAFSDDWGAPRPGGRRHQGNDILAPLGTPIVAPVSGRFEPTFDRDGGLTFRLYGADGNFYWGDHLSGHEGPARNVSAGEVIGYVGNTGDARGGPYHLHFEVHPGNGSPVNPYPWVSRYC